MKPIILFLFLISFSPLAIDAQSFYSHKSEAKIAQMTPAQHVDEWVKEQLNHRFDVLDKQGNLIGKYIRLDGLKAVPRIIEIMDEYDPTRASGRGGDKAERYDAAWMPLIDIDEHVARLRASEEGRHGIDALERSVERMRAAGYANKNEVKWSKYSRFNFAMHLLKNVKGINDIDEGIQSTFRYKYKIIISNAELLELSNFLTERYPDYPSWSEWELTENHMQSVLPGGEPVPVSVLEKPKRYYEAYQEFKKTNH